MASVYYRFFAHGKLIQLAFYTNCINTLVMDASHTLRGIVIAHESQSGRKSGEFQAVGWGGVGRVRVDGWGSSGDVPGIPLVEMIRGHVGLRVYVGRFGNRPLTLTNPPTLGPHKSLETKCRGRIAQVNVTSFLTLAPGQTPSDTCPAGLQNEDRP